MKSKRSLRKEYQDKRERLSEDNIHKLSLDIANNILKLDIWSFKNFHLFLPIENKKEVQTEYIMQVLQGRDKNIVLSRSDFKTMEMRHFLLTDQTVIRNNNYGIPEPEGDDFEVDPKQLDVIFVPLLAVDHNGSRIGYGKGFYDRFLNQCRPNALKIGVSFFEPLDEEILANQTDVSIDQLVTPYSVITF
ncbi:5-formyltetrahydrofolate cyclo-ligase [Nonlabens sp. YIK11]|uniref:5-formyltetrahydrofolate cyclo-ligase n=1 Tax=Nonlabens sp. YIK11 TaxID=1453349 RepID=UPI0006DCA539|nr:5-formyltetrahydrofolate cyclo-ligase [Nonlabens sp. YIK11]KQC32048.1 5-formyltetrahydrofolate cyclo-ligase [Nonlabens sp. YIK11]